MTMNLLTIKIINREEFRNLLIESLVHNVKDWSHKEIYDYLLDNGFEKLNFDDLNKSLKGKFVYLPTVAVDIGDNKFVWVVSGNNAILVEKNNFMPTVVCDK
jgi:hypothetical protein